LQCHAVEAPAGTKLMPHRHPEDRIYTVMSGVFYIGLGDQFDGDKVEAFPPGSVIVLPGNTSYFHWAKFGEYITQVTAISPLGLGTRRRSSHKAPLRTSFQTLNVDQRLSIGGNFLPAFVIF
jgi:hypothetical protein